MFVVRSIWLFHCFDYQRGIGRPCIKKRSNHIAINLRKWLRTLVNTAFDFENLIEVCHSFEFVKRAESHISSSETKTSIATAFVLHACFSASLNFLWSCHVGLVFEEKQD